MRLRSGVMGSRLQEQKKFSVAGVQKVKERLALEAVGKLDKKLRTWLDVNTTYSDKENQKGHKL